MQVPTTVHPEPSATPSTTTQREPLGGLLVDYGAATATSWLIGGLYLDGWAHGHVPELETFFTPWHGVLYTGFLAFAVFLIGVVVWNYRRAGAWARAVPAGYGLALIGTGLFAAGGVGDMLWHLRFGIERDVEALLSPTHLVLAVGAGLMVTGPLRAAWQRPHVPTWATWGPVLLSVLAVLSLIAFFTSYIHPFIRTSAAGLFGPSNHAAEHASLDTGIAAVLIQTTVVMSVVLLLVRRWHERLPVGTLTLLLGVHTAMLTAVFDQDRALSAWPLLTAAVLAGLVGDGALRVLRPSPRRSLQLRAFAATLPTALYGFYFGALAVTSGIWWTVHLWTGTIVLAGITGWLLSIVVVPAPGLLSGDTDDGTDTRRDE